MSKQLPKQQNELSKYFECCFERLDNNFIDQEELRKKINDIDIWHKNGLQLKKEILELLK